MHNRTFATLALVLAAAAAVADDGGQLAADVAASRQLAQTFMQTLAGALKTQLAAGGAVGAVTVCKRLAPALAADYSKDGLSLRRVALKNRNPTLGVADDWERAVLRQFEHSLGKGAAAGDLEHWAVVATADGPRFRYMKAITTQAVCLQCHGGPQDISADVKALLAKEYPDDLAVGHRPGDLRGAISITKAAAAPIRGE